jgi:transcriptional regulator with XRE-family HTH domain
MTQENLADNSNVTYEAINRLERGKSWPKLETVENIRAALGCRYSELFDFSDLDEKTA